MHNIHLARIIRANASYRLPASLAILAWTERPRLGVPVANTVCIPLSGQIHCKKTVCIAKTRHLHEYSGLVVCQEPDRE